MQDLGDSICGHQKKTKKTDGKHGVFNKFFFFVQIGVRNSKKCGWCRGCRTVKKRMLFREAVLRGCADSSFAMLTLFYFSPFTFFLFFHFSTFFSLFTLLPFHPFSLSPFYPLFSVLGSLFFVLFFFFVLCSLIFSSFPRFLFSSFPFFLFLIFFLFSSFSSFLFPFSFHHTTPKEDGIAAPTKAAPSQKTKGDSSTTPKKKWRKRSTACT